jgi:hypothetical protein
MPVTFVRDPVTGVTYSVNISGSTPTEQESARINQFLASQRTLSVLPQAQPVEEEETMALPLVADFVVAIQEHSISHRHCN